MVESWGATIANEGLVEIRGTRRCAVAALVRRSIIINTLMNGFSYGSLPFLWAAAPDLGFTNH